MWFFRSITIAPPPFYEIPLQHVAKANCLQILKKIVKSILSQNFINHHQSAFHSPITKFLSSNIKKILKIQWFLPQKFPTRRKSIIVPKFSKEKKSNPSAKFPLDQSSSTAYQFRSQTLITPSQKFSPRQASPTTSPQGQKESR